jgi:hypothetical protein
VVSTLEENILVYDSDSTDTYEPEPIDTSEVQLDREVLELTETLAKNTHEMWAQERKAEGWTYGGERDDAEKKHPSLVPYEELTDDEKEYDRKTAMETLKVMLVLGYRIEKAP